MSIIYIGLTGWGDHHSLYENTGGKDRLRTYSSYFPIVEVDSSFYAIQSETTFKKWAAETPSSFRFIVKAYQAMTGHKRSIEPYSTREEMFQAFHESVAPLVNENRLVCILCQFPPWFDCKKEHVQWLRYIKRQLEPLPVSLEFRHQSWFQQRFYEKTLAFMRDEGWIHTICDEPQAGAGSVPTILEPTHQKTVIRLHGRNVHGWNDPGNGRWRDVRYLYKYNEKELSEWKTHLIKLQEKTDDIYMIFNNNSGGDAAGNALQLINLLGIEYKELAPRQLDLF